jgi:hypothetical protein
LASTNKKTPPRTHPTPPPPLSQSNQQISYTRFLTVERLRSARKRRELTATAKPTKPKITEAGVTSGIGAKPVAAAVHSAKPPFPWATKYNITVAIAPVLTSKMVLIFM